jgi:hypothetical protein
LPDTGGGLNAVLEDARRTLIARGAGELLVLPADLPLITATDIPDAGRAPPSLRCTGRHLALRFLRPVTSPGRNS